MASSSQAGSIRKLDEVVVNRIAAGEVIQRPANALKEMIENSLDAGSTSIQVNVRQGGLKLLEIHDDGSGIKKEDMTIVCERFTTSKLRQFEDLAAIATYGFRGEALASISHVAHVTITSRTRDSKCAFKGSYVDGVLKDPVKPCAGNVGTKITAEDLFYNVPTRRRTLKSASEEYSRVAEVVSRYAIHNCKCGFSLKKEGESGFGDVRTPSNSNHVDNIRTIFGNAVAKELVEINTEDKNFGFKMKGLCSTANYTGQKFVLLLFINHRLVDSTLLRKKLKEVYQVYLPQGTNPFVYMSIEILPQNVDVNVHPTKHEVHFLHEESIFKLIGDAVDERLLSQKKPRTFLVQGTLPSAKVVEETGKEARVQSNDPLRPTEMVRTDSKEQKIDAFLRKPKQSVLAEKDSSQTVVNQESSDVPRREIKLSSVLQLRKEVTETMSQGLVDMMKNHKFVGCINENLAMIQHQTKLYMVNTTTLSEQLFYQLFLEDFGNFGLLKLSEGAPVKELVLLALEQAREEGDAQALQGLAGEDPEDLASQVQELLVNRADMLLDYFSLEISEEGILEGLPMLLEGYVPAMDNLPAFMLHLAVKVNWESEKDCFETFAKETARFYAFRKSRLQVEEAEDEMETDGSETSHPKQDWKWTVEHILYPAIKSSLKPKIESESDRTVIQLANLHEIYTVFERC